jgi:hypothetical protein
VLWKSRLRGRFGTQSRDTSRATKSGGRQPAVDVVTASATAFVHGRPAGRRCAAIVVLPLQARYTNHGWLTPAAPDARRRCTEKATFAVQNRMFPRAAGVSPPCFAIRTLCRENQRITSRRCDPQNRSGEHQPAVLWKSRLPGRFGTQSRDTSRATKSGGRQPAVDVVTASATAFVHGRPAGRRCAAIVVLPLQARYTNHGWLTPAAPDARRRCTEKNDIRGAQSHVPKSGGRQPAVACYKNAVLRESRTVGRPRDPGTEAARINPPWLPESRRQRRPVFAGELHLHRTSGSRTTAGLRQPLQMHDAGALKKRHSRCTIACSQERRASAHRGRRTEPSAARITHCSPTALPLNKSGGRQPAVLCYKNAVPQESTHC